MPTYISTAQWQGIEPSLRKKGISPADYMRQHDIFVDDRLAAKQGTQTAPSTEGMRPSMRQNDMAVYGDEEENAFAVQPNEGKEESDLAAKPGVSILDNLATRQRQSINTLYSTIEKNIKERYRAPDINDMLVAIGMGMMSAPGENDSGGFGGALQRGLRGIGTYAQNRRAYETDMNKLLSEVEVEKAKRLADFEEKYLTSVASAMKPGSAGMTYDAQRGVWVNRANPRPTENTYDIGNGRSLVQWQDGLWREALPNGTYKVFERAGNNFTELGIEGAR